MQIKELQADDSDVEELLYQQRRCNDSKIHNAEGGHIPVMLLGVSVLIALGFMILYFFGEQSGIVPILSLITINGLSSGDSVMVFMTAFLLIIFIIILILWYTMKAVRKNKCRKIETFINKYNIKKVNSS